MTTDHHLHTPTPTADAAGTWQLGDRTVNRLGLGAMRLGGMPWEPPRNRDDALAVLRRAVELGVDHIDTAAFYFTPTRLANELISTALQPFPDDLTLVTKVGPSRSRDGEFAEGCPTWLHPNADEQGYYRWRVPSVALVALSGAEPSRTHAARRRLIAMEGVSVQGLPLRIVELPTGEALESALVREQVDVAVLVGGAPPEELERVSGVLRGHRVLTLSLEPEHLGHGCGVGVGVERGRARLVVDLTAARSSGADFSGELLQLAKVMR